MCPRLWGSSRCRLRRTLATESGVSTATHVIPGANRGREDVTRPVQPSQHLTRLYITQMLIELVLQIGYNQEPEEKRRQK